MTVKLRQVRNSIDLPMPLDIGTQQAIGITVDNYSGYWLQVGNGPLFVPPYTIGWANNFDGSTASSIDIRKQSPSALVSNPAIGQESTIVATLYDTAVGPNPGIVISAKPIATFVDSGNGVAAGTLDITTFTPPIVGLSVSLEGMTIAGAAGIGTAVFSLRDATANSVTLIHLALSTLAPVALAIPLNGTTFSQISTLAPPWTLRRVLTDRVNVNTFYTRFILSVIQ